MKQNKVNIFMSFMKQNNINKFPTFLWEDDFNIITKKGKMT